jgi:hypothetical protein
VGFLILLVAFVALGVAFNKLVLNRPYFDSLMNGWLLDQRERWLHVPVVSAAVWPRSEAAYLRFNRAVASVVLGVFAAAGFGTVVAVAWRALGLN